VRERRILAAAGRAYGGAMTDPHDGALIPDACTTDPDKYRVVFENPRVRVLAYRDRPGDHTHLHRHPDFVLIALSSFRRRLVFPDGSSRERAFEAGESHWVPAQAHIGQNIGATDTHVLLVELK
jgi:hypothetical protein